MPSNPFSLLSRLKRLDYYENVLKAAEYFVKLRRKELKRMLRQEVKSTSERERRMMEEELRKKIQSEMEKRMRAEAQMQSRMMPEDVETQSNVPRTGSASSGNDQNGRRFSWRDRMSRIGESVVVTVIGTIICTQILQHTPNLVGIVSSLFKHFDSSMEAESPPTIASSSYDNDTSKDDVSPPPSGRGRGGGALPGVLLDLSMNGDRDSPDSHELNIVHLVGKPMLHMHLIVPEGASMAKWKASLQHYCAVTQEDQVKIWVCPESSLVLMRMMKCNIRRDPYTWRFKFKPVIKILHRPCIPKDEDDCLSNNYFEEGPIMSLMIDDLYSPPLSSRMVQLPQVVSDMDPEYPFVDAIEIFTRKENTCQFKASIKDYIIVMDRGKHKQLTYEDYFAFYHDRCADHLTIDQLNQEEVIDAVKSLHLILPSRSIFPSGAAQPGSSGAMSPLYLGEAKHDMAKTGWAECPVGSVAAICTPINGVVSYEDEVISRSSSCVSVTSSRSKKIAKGKDERLFKKEDIDDMSVISALLSLKSGGEPQTNNVEMNTEGKKTIHVPAKNLRSADEYSWRNRGTQWIKGMPFPRTYYRCKKDGCPVIRHVDRDPADPSMLIVSYKMEHNHT